MVETTKTDVARMISMETFKTTKYRLDSVTLMLCLVCLAMLSSGCNKIEQNQQTPTFTKKSTSNKKLYIFSVHPLHNPKRLHEIFGPVIDHLSKNIDEAQFRLEASRNYATYDKKLYNGKFHFSLPNPFQTVNSLNKGYRVFGKMSDDHNFRGIILVRKDSGIRKVSDLKNKDISYPAPTALAATMMPQYYLHTHGLNVLKDVRTHYVGSQESSIMNVYMGHTIAGATWPPPWQALSKERPELKRDLKVIWQTKPLPNNGLVVRSDVPDKLTKQVAKLLFSLHTHDKGKQWLEKMELSRFEPANSATYKPVRQFIDKFHQEVRPVK